MHFLYLICSCDEWCCCIENLSIYSLFSSFCCLSYSSTGQVINWSSHMSRQCCTRGPLVTIDGKSTTPNYKRYKRNLWERKSGESFVFVPTRHLDFVLYLRSEADFHLSSDSLSHLLYLVGRWAVHWVCGLPRRFFLWEGLMDPPRGASRRHPELTSTVGGASRSLQTRM